MLTGQRVWRTAIRNLFAFREGAAPPGAPSRESVRRGDFAQAAEVVEARTLLSSPSFANAIDSQFQNDGATVGTGYLDGAGVKTDGAGNVYVNGAYAGTGNINPLGTTPYTVTSSIGQGFLAKYDSNLNLLWVVDPGKYSSTTCGAGFGVLVSPVSGDLFAGMTCGGGGTVTLPTAQGTLTVPAGGYMMRLDPSTGNVLWLVQCNFGASAIDAFGNLYFQMQLKGPPSTNWNYIYGPGTGGNPITFQPSLAGYNEDYMVKCDSNGNVVWSGNFSTTNAKAPGSSWAGGFTVDSAGNMYINFELAAKGTLDVDPGPGVKTITGVTADDNVIVKIDATGHLAWVNQNTKAACDPGGLVMDQNGNLDAIFASTYAVSVTVTGKGKNQVTTVTGGNVCQFDTNGNLVWYKMDQTLAEYTSHNARFIGWDPAGNLTVNIGGSTFDNTELTKISVATDSIVWSVPNYGYIIDCLNIDVFGNIWTAGEATDTSSTTVNVSPTSTPNNLYWRFGPGQWVYMLVEWAPPAALPSTAQSAGTMQALSSNLVTTPNSSAPLMRQPVLFVGDTSSFDDGIVAGGTAKKNKNLHLTH